MPNKNEKEILDFMNGLRDYGFDFEFKVTINATGQVLTSALWNEPAKYLRGEFVTPSESNLASKKGA